MASSIDYLEYVLDLCRDIKIITYKKMMGEFLLYKNNILFGGIYDDRFLIKKTKSVESLGFKEVIPYPSAKAMLLIDIEDNEEIERMKNENIADIKKQIIEVAYAMASKIVEKEIEEDKYDIQVEKFMKEEK